MDWRVRRVLDMMTGELHRPLGVAELARRINLSPSRFTHLFQREIGCPPLRYLRERRLDAARALAEESVLSVKEIMAHVGFNDVSHFVRDFKRRHGASPRTLRARVRSPDEQHVPPSNSGNGQHSRGLSCDTPPYPDRVGTQSGVRTSGSGT